jgi:CheY-specific phosphatase CheX
MEQNLRGHLYHSAVRIFEELTFMFTDSDLEPAQSEAPFEAGASVRFRGPLEGKLTVYLFGNVLSALSSNMLADAENPNREMQLDALKEVVNVICGNLLPLVAGKGAVFDLNPPDIVTSVEPQEEDGLEDHVSVIGLEGGRAELVLHVVNANGSSPWRPV